VVELDPQGNEQRALLVEPRGEIRVVGARAGSLVGWRDGRQVLLSRVGHDRAFAVGLLGPDGAEILRVDRDGKVASQWRDPAATSVPPLAGSAGKRMIERYHGASLRHDVIAAPR